MMIFFNPERCVGCFACQVACKAEKDLPAGPRWVRVLGSELEAEGAGWRTYYRALRCLQCADSPCVRVCPVRAIRYEEKGIVTVKSEKCIGCRLCLVVCPFAVPAFNSHQQMTKCNFCLERTQVGLKPACVAACPVAALETGHPQEAARRKRKQLLQKIWRL